MLRKHRAFRTHVRAADGNNHRGSHMPGEISRIMREISRNPVVLIVDGERNMCVR